MKYVKNKFPFLLVLLSLLFMVSCTKDETRNQLFIYQEGADFDTSIPMGYQLYPTTDQVIVIWNEGAKSHTTDLLVFTEDDSTIEFSYSDKSDMNLTKTFDIQSDSVVIDETNREYQWFGE